MSPLLARLFEKWKAGGAAPRPPVAADTIAAFETRYRVRLPADFREYLAVCDGMTDGEMDGDLFSFWGLARIRPIPEELSEDMYREYRMFTRAQCFFCFADWSLDGDIFAIELHADPATPNRLTALGPRYLPWSSFSEFVAAYLDDPQVLLG